MKRIIIEEEYIIGWSERYEYDIYRNPTTKSNIYFEEPYTTDERFEELKKKAIKEYEKLESESNYVWCRPQFIKYWKEIDKKILSEV